MEATGRTGRLTLLISAILTKEPALGFNLMNQLAELLLE
jgi:hypothetical protein